MTVAEKITALESGIVKLRELSTASACLKPAEQAAAERKQTELGFDIARASLALLGGALIDLNRIASALEEIEMNTRRNA